MLRVLGEEVPKGALGGGSSGESFQRTYEINLQWQAGVKGIQEGGRQP